MSWPLFVSQSEETVAGISRYGNYPVNDTFQINSKHVNGLIKISGDWKKYQNVLLSGQKLISDRFPY